MMQLRDADEANNVRHERFHGMQQSWIIRDPVLVATTDYMDTELNLVSMLWRTRKNTEGCIFPLAAADGVIGGPTETETREPARRLNIRRLVVSQAVVERRKPVLHETPGVDNT